MNSPVLANVPTSAPEALPVTLIYWPTLAVAEQAFVAAYVENNYSLAETSRALEIGTHTLQKLLNKPVIRRAISEVQNDIDSLDFMNEKWVKAQLLKLFPKVMGEEAVPVVNALGDEMEVRKFMPDIAMRILEYVHPKTTAGKANGNTAAVQVTINMGAMGVGHDAGVTVNG